MVIVPTNVDFLRRADTILRVHSNKEQHSILKELLHELRSPLAALSYQAQGTNEIKAIEHIQNLCSRYEQIITNSYESVVRRVSIQEITREAFAIVDSRCTGRLEHLLVKVPALYVWADPLLLRQVLINIITNAYNHGQSNTLDMRVTSEEDNYLLVHIEHSTISDRVPSHADSKDFDTKNWGVGIPLAYELTSAMGGSMSVTKNEGLWAVDVRLPACT